MTTFYLGTHMPNWLETAGVPLFISHSRLSKLKKHLPRATHAWALDSGGFTELKHHGGWRITAEQYAAGVRRYRDQIGHMDWAAPQDWMCEPWVISGKHQEDPSHKDYFHGTRGARGIPDDGPDEDLASAILKHQRYTVDNYLELREIAPDLPFIPVLQGWQLNDYLHCAEMYAEAGVDLTAAPLVGLGSVCRRQGTSEIDLIASTLHARGYELHGFGVKTLGLAVYGPCLTSADSLAWSSRGRNVHPCAHGPNRFGRTANSEANCLTFALKWRQRVLDVLAAPVQLGLPFGEAA